MQQPEHDNLNCYSTFLDVIDIEISALAQCAKLLRSQRSEIQEACRLLGQTDHIDRSKVITSGIGKVGLIAKKISATLTSTGTPSVFIHPVEALHGDFGTIQNGDSALVLSYSGETRESVRFALELQRLSVPILAITKNKSSSLGRLAQVVLETGEIDEACPNRLAPSSSTTVMLAIGDALALSIAKQKGFSANTFARNHPGGSLGLSLTSVTETMRTGASLVCVSPSTSVRNTIAAITSAKTAAAIVTDETKRLLGIFTDGDLRRAILRDDDFLSLPVSTFSTCPCHFLQHTDTLSEALRVFRITKTEELPVVSNKTVTGLLCLKDIPQV